MISDDSRLEAALRSALHDNVQTWYDAGLLSRFSDVVASVRADRVVISARMWFDPEDVRSQQVLRPAIHEFGLNLARTHSLRLAMMDIDDPDGARSHDYVARGGIVIITYFR